MTEQLQILERPKARSRVSCNHVHDTAPVCMCGAPAIQALHERVTADLSRRGFLMSGAAATASLFAGMTPGEADAQQSKPVARPTLLTNLRLFDGRHMKPGVNILVEENRVKALPPVAEKVEGAQVVDCGGRLAMPGLIDVHWHSMMCGISEMVALTADVPYIHLVAARVAEQTLLQGFTSVRDIGGPAFALKRAIDEGLVKGPRIFPSGAMISQTSGHGDFRMRYEVPRGNGAPLSHAEKTGFGIIADGRAEVLRRVREQLMLGASQIKMMAGGGVSSHYDPIDSTQYSEEELRAGVEAAADWNTYVAVHVYTPKGIKRAVKAGVKSIEHGQLADEEAVRMMADAGVWWSLQPFLMDEDANPKALPEQRAQQRRIAEGTIRAYAMAKKHKVRTGWGTDILFNPKGLASHGRQLAKLAPRFYQPLEMLSIATAENGDLLGLSGPRAPYKGALGTIVAGGFADILVADGDPTASLDFLADPDRNLRLIMKDGRIYKDTLK